MEMYMDTGVNANGNNQQNDAQVANKQTEDVNVSPMVNDFNLPLELQQQITQKANSLKAAKKLKHVFVIKVNGEVGTGELPYYIGYFRRPNLMEFSQYMTFVQKDIVQANMMLAKSTFLDGNRELVDDEDLFLYGTMQQLSHIIDSRNSDIVKK